MLSRHLSMNFVRNLALSPTGSAARRSAARRRSSFVGTLVFCWRFLMRNCLNASWSDGPVSRSASSSWPLAFMSASGAMGCGHWAAYERVRRGSGGAAKTAGRLWAAVRQDVRHRHRLPGNIPTTLGRAAAIAAIHGPSCRPQRLGRRLQFQGNPYQASGRKALAKVISKAAKTGRTMRR